MEFTQIKETCLYVSNLHKTRAFYEGLLKMPVISMVEDRHVFFRTGTSVLLCFIADSTKNEQELPPHYASGKQHIAFELEKKLYEDVKKEATELDITITHTQPWPGGYESFYFEDPDGHVLEIVPAGMWG